MLLSVPVAFAFLSANILGAVLFLGGSAGLVSFVRGMVSSVANYNLAPIPLFIFMGEILFRTGVAYSAINAVDRLISKVPGRLSIVALGGGTVFSALSGSTIANTAMLGGVMLPEMQKRGYSPALSMGPIMAVGGIAMLIPPSALAVLLASLARMPVAELLAGGIIPGLLMAGLFISYVVVRSSLNPRLAPTYDMQKFTWRERIVPFLTDVLPLSLVFISVLGSIIAGIASPTESAALGALSALLLAAYYRKLSWRSLWMAIEETGKTSVMILFIVACSTTFSQILAFSGATDGALTLILQREMTPLVAMAVMMMVLVVLGCFVDQISMMLITLPFFLPMADALGVNEIWLGVMMLIAIELGLITPPFGLLIFVMKGVVGDSYGIRTIYAAAFPFVLLELIVLAVLLLIPNIVTFLPSYL
ncbi:TRAP transporter large permease subunit [Hoeflea sp. CAU 1731]